MSYLIDKPTFAAQICDVLMTRAGVPGQGADAMRLIQILAGVMVETLLLFEEPEEGVDVTMAKLAMMLDCQPYDGVLGTLALPPACIMDYEIEQGRSVARQFFENWLNCAYEFHDLLLFIIHNILCQLNVDGQPKAEMLRLFYECLIKGLSYEIAAQELCDIVIDNKIGGEGWGLAESVSGLSAIAGRRLAMYHNSCELFQSPTLPDKLDQIAYVMTQEAVRLGIPAGTDWRFGLAANDCPVSAPHELISGLEPECRLFFRVIELHDLMDQAVACAKAAGRMLAVVAGGETPELEPVIAKPLAIAAMADTYRLVCQDEAVLMSW